MITEMNYTSIATPPDGVVVSRTYILEKDSDGYFFVCDTGKKYMGIKFIKALFTPKGQSWADVFKVTSKRQKKDVGQVSIKNIDENKNDFEC